MSKNKQSKTFSFFTASVITIVSITLVLFLLGLTALIGFTARGFTSYLKENMGISVELADNLSEKEIARIQKELDANTYIKSAVYITKDEVKKQLIDDLGRDPEEVLGYNPAKSYFDISVKAEYVNTDSIELVYSSLKGKSLVKSLIYNEDDIAQASSNLSTVGSILLILAVILVFISFTLIRSIIQLNIYSKRFLINTMRLVGATNAFIRKPFIKNMVGCGIIAGVLANTLLAGVVYYVTSAFPLSIVMVSSKELLIVFGLVIIFGVFIAVFATATAVNRYLRMHSNKLYRV